jgi:hypothetical protein
MLDRPIFIIGTGRSGTSVMFRFLSPHPGVGWVHKDREERFSNAWGVRVLDRLLHTAGRSVKRRTVREPVGEAYWFWDKYTLGFSRPCRDLEAADVYPLLAERIREGVMQQLRPLNRSRFLTKYTGWSRIAFINAVFPDALFLHVVRDGRAVAWSLMKMPWWQGWGGPCQWRWGELSEQDRALWEASGKSFFVLAGLQWKICLESVRRHAGPVAGRIHEIRYEAFVRNPEKEVTRALDFAGLDRDPKYLSGLGREEVIDANKKWVREVPIEQRKQFESLLGDALETYGYT